MEPLHTAKQLLPDQSTVKSSQDDFIFEVGNRNEARVKLNRIELGCYVIYPSSRGPHIFSAFPNPCEWQDAPITITLPQNPAPTMLAAKTKLKEIISQIPLFKSEEKAQSVLSNAEDTFYGIVVKPSMMLGHKDYKFVWKPNALLDGVFTVAKFPDIEKMINNSSTRIGLSYYRFAHVEFQLAIVNSIILAMQNHTYNNLEEAKRFVEGYPQYLSTLSAEVTSNGRALAFVMNESECCMVTTLGDPLHFSKKDVEELNRRREFLRAEGIRLLNLCEYMNVEQQEMFRRYQLRSSDMFESDHFKAFLVVAPLIDFQTAQLQKENRLEAFHLAPPKNRVIYINKINLV